MKFLDEAKVYVKSGDGGNGCVAFLRLKFIAFGGPNGRTVYMTARTSLYAVETLVGGGK